MAANLGSAYFAKCKSCKVMEASTQVSREILGVKQYVTWSEFLQVALPLRVWCVKYRGGEWDGGVKLQMKWISKEARHSRSHDVCLGKPQTILQASPEERADRLQMLCPLGQRCQISSERISGHVPCLHGMHLGDFAAALPSWYLFWFHFSSFPSTAMEYKLLARSLWLAV